MSDTPREDPAGTMRRAAQRMRRRAEAVQHYATPWRTIGPGDDSDRWSVAYTTDHPAAGLLALTPDYGTWNLPDYIASWHPLVALAVASLLEDRAKMADDQLSPDTPEGPCCEPPTACRGHDPEWGCNRCAVYLSSGSCRCGFTEALAVARAYLGEPEGS